ncbi:hypothetical protein M404DRAFT_23490 [Pisolithus tinctorius Marx 270]|uniref:Uncharacterized protein n=1 Tax=Pisolithus tinctorius Marx 270 TaxID=870435 RepID=A0A0C3PGW1_PISTI|nr:hypothetical protein M404DRAFT_23490 [Pisolithus tinctorius Marx 270]
MSMHHCHVTVSFELFRLTDPSNSLLRLVAACGPSKAATTNSTDETSLYLGSESLQRGDDDLAWHDDVQGEISFAEPEPDYRPSGLPNRVRHLPRRYCDELPSLHNPVPPITHLNDGTDAVPSSDLPSHPDSPLLIDLEDFESSYINTEPDSYGIFCSYFRNFPTYDPENLQSLDETFESSTFEPRCGLPPNNSWWSGLGL